MILNVDLSKEYSKFSWLYIWLILIQIVFSHTFENWVMSCVHTVSFIVLINGSTSKFFIPRKGIIQGYPLAPLLFLLVVEGLSKSLEEENVWGMFKGIKMGSSLLNSHPRFLYDILIFCDESIDDSINLKYISELYCKALGMTINEAYVRICNDDLCGILVKYNLRE